MDAPDGVAEANAVALDLLRLYREMGVPALVITLEAGAIYVRCQRSEDVVYLCRRVVEEHEPAGDRTVN